MTDEQGRVVPNAVVSLTSLATNSVRTTKTSDTGGYVFDLIIPADYRIEVEAKGFKKNVLDNVKALIGKQTESNVQLSVGAATEVVEVQASAQDAVINTQDATLGNNFESVQITQLPLEARSVIDLLSLQPGATREGYVTGARADQSNITLDGVDINNAQTGNAEVPRGTNGLIVGALDSDRGDITTGPALRLNSEALEEFRVTTANGNANQGRSSGSQVNLITKSGTNRWHGAGSEFYRSRGFTANDWFNNHADPIVPRTPLVRNTFGGNFGGPIVKDKAFFFYAYEGRHDASGQSVVRTVPLANVGQGQINDQYCADSACNTVNESSLTVTPSNPGPFQDAGINQVALDVLAAAAAKYPANDKTTGDQLNTGGFRFNAPTPTTLNSHVAKLDFNLTQHQTAFFQLNVQYDHQLLPKWLPDTPSPGDQELIHGDWRRGIPGPLEIMSSIVFDMASLDRLSPRVVTVPATISISVLCSPPIPSRTDFRGSRLFITSPTTFPGLKEITISSSDLISGKPTISGSAMPVRMILRKRIHPPI